MDRLQSLYKAAVLRHNRNPVGYERAVQATHRATELNPLCGDVIHIALQVDEHHCIRDAGFSGQSCAICTASASMLCESLPGFSATDFERRRAQFEAAMAGDETAQQALPESFKALLGVRRFASRIPCAQLPWKAARSALQAPAEETA